tara:strand:+ start:253 stop:489 length:237 start_codon:yes stop_codon:yes gene_type:complete
MVLIQEDLLLELVRVVRVVQEQMYHLFMEILVQLVQSSLVVVEVVEVEIILVQVLYNLIILVLVELVVVELVQEILRL